MKHNNREDKQNVAVTEESGVALHPYPAQYQSQYASPPRGMAGDFQPQSMARAPHPQDTGMGPQYPQDMTGMGTQYPQAMTSVPYSQAMVRDANQQQDIPNGNELVYTDSMIISIVSCLFCWIIGLFAISKARNAREAFRHGDIARAVALSQTARKMAIAGIVLGLIIIVLNVMRSALDLF